MTKSIHESINEPERGQESQGATWREISEANIKDR